MAQGILLDKSQLLEVIFEEDYCQIIYGFHIFQEFHKDDLTALRISVVQLVKMGVMKSKLSNVFKIHHKTIEKWEKVYHKKGLDGLVTMENGRKPKCDEIVEKYIVDLADKLRKGNGYKEIIIDEVRKLFGIEISREIIRRVLNKHAETNKTKEKVVKDKGGTKEAPGDQDSVAVKNGGVLLTLPLLSKHKVDKIIPEGEEEKKHGGFSFNDVVMTISTLMTGGLLKNEEQIKMHDSSCMGEILRMKQLPSLRTLRRFIPQLLEKTDLSQLKRRFAALYIKLYVGSFIFYIDGHFMPYHGKEKILYGYNSLRRMPMRGRTSYVVNSETGRPIYQILSDNFDNFMDNIERIITFLKERIGKGKPLLVFDRGGFGEEFFSKIKDKVYFICWSKSKSRPPKGEWRRVIRYFQSNEYGVNEEETLQVKEEVIEIDKKGKRFTLRRLFIKKGEKISAAVTNDFERSVGELTGTLTKRWGIQENVFKELKKIGYDNIHSYWKDEYSQKMLLENEIDINKEMVNPEYKTAVEKRKELKAILNKLRIEAGKKLLGKKKSSAVVKIQDEFKNKIEEVQKEIGSINGRIAYLPEKILRFDYVTENIILRLGSEKKEFFDLLKFITYNVRRDIAEIVGPIYKDNRDIHTIIVKWLQSKCMVRKLNNKLIVSFECPKRKNEKEALKELCKYLNSLNYKHFNKNEILQYTIAQSV